LFETIDDLRHSDDHLNALLNNEDFASHLKSCNNQLTCMIGYSDSAKDGGYMGANWELYNAQRRLASCAKNHGTTLTIFHGRGGAIGRGGGPTARAILSLPREAVEARIRLTEQGEVIAERYDDPKIATRHLEQLFWATLVQSAPDQSGSFSEAETFAEKLAGYSVAAYRELVQMPVFIDYLQSCTALSLIESLPIGSRPSRRSKTTSLEDLRAIPFTFAWNQVRMPINAFYGLGAAFQGLGPDSLSIGAELYKTWPWFKAVINNAELALARCDPGIARRYLDHAPDPIAARELWDKLNNEYELSCKAVLAIKKEGELIEGVPWLSRTVRIRTPYLDILNVIQSNLLTARNQHMHDSPNEELHEAMRLTVQSIAAGLRNTG
jgi:phosphoenolpyruvate carboxylase